MCAASPPSPPAPELHVGHQCRQGLSPPNATSFRKIGFLAPDEAVGIDIHTNAAHVLRDTQISGPQTRPRCGDSWAEEAGSSPAGAESQRWLQCCPNRFLTTYPNLFSLNTKARNTLVYHVKVTRDVLERKWFPEETEELSFSWPICTRCIFSVLRAHRVFTCKGEASWLVPRIFSPMTHSKVTAKYILWALRKNKWTSKDF